MNISHFIQRLNRICIHDWIDWLTQPGVPLC